MNKISKQILIGAFSLLNLFSFSQIIYTVAGNGWGNFSGDGGQANAASVNLPNNLKADASGNLFFADEQNHRIRKISNTGIITTVAGNGVGGFSSDGVAATSSQLDSPMDVAIDASGNIFIADYNNSRIRKVSTSGIISTIAGTGVGGYSGDGGPATSAQIFKPKGLAVDPAGNIYISENSGNRIRMVSASGTITTIAGTGVSGYSGDGGPATSAQIAFPEGIAVDATGNIYFADNFNARIRKINTSGIISTFAGNGSPGFGGDNGPATSAMIWSPRAVAVDASNNVYIADYGNSCVRKVTPTGTITSYAGNGGCCFSGDGGLAVNATMSGPSGLALDLSSNLFIADKVNHRIRVVCPSNCLAGINQLEKTDASVTLFPNPNNGSFKLKLNSATSGECEIIITNCLGQTVLSKKTENETVDFDIKNNLSGIYFFKVISSNVVLAAGKFIIE